MSLKSTKEIEVNKYELTIEVDAQTFEEGLKKAYLKENKKITVPGFRKGKAPRKFVEQYYGKAVFYDEAVEQTYSKALNDAIAESGLNVIPNSIDLKLGNIDENGYSFTATLFTYPNVNIANYKGIEVETKSDEVTDEDLNKAIDEAREKVSRFISIEDRAAQKDDIAVIDFKGFVDGEAFEGGQGEGYSLTLGSNQFIPGFEDQVIGHNVSDEFDVNVTFPEDYFNEDLKGKDAKFEVVIHELKKKELPEFDDEFVKDISDFDTVDEYKKDLEEKLSEQKKKDAQAFIDNQVSDKLVELVEGDIPEIMIENKIDDNLRDFEYRLKSQGLDIENYMKYTGLTKDDLRKGLRDNSEKFVKLRLALEKIAELENIAVEDEDLENEYNKMAENWKIDAEQVKNFINKEDLSSDIKVDKALKLVKDSIITK
ncbi:MAG: trigger factor [Clostridia bacterium]|nr:trigger factor [Clostridia bacterium]